MNQIFTHQYKIKYIPNFPTFANRFKSIFMTQIYKLVLVFFILIFAACSSVKQAKKSNINTTDSTARYGISDKFIDAKRQLYQGDSDAAIKGFEACIKANPQHDASYYELARINENVNPNTAIELINKAIEIDPKNIWYREFLLRVYQQQKQFKNAIKVNKDLISLEPTRKEYYYQWANICIRDEDYKQALTAYNQINTKFGYEDGVMRQIKQIYLKQGNYNKAIETLRKMVQYEPNNTDYYGMIAEIYSKQGQHKKAMEYYQKILDINPQDGFVHFALADYYREMNKKDDAIEELKKGMSSSSLDVESKMKVLLSVLEIAKVDTSYTPYFNDLLDIALRTNPNEAKILALKADIYMQNNDAANAVKFYRNVLSLDSSKFVIWNQLLLAEEQLNDYESIKNESERALHLFPQQPDIYYFNASALAKLGYWEKAKERISIGNNFVYNINQKALFLALRARSEMQLGEKDNAKANFERAISMDPSNTEIKKDFAFALASHNMDFEEAVRYSKSALELNADNPDYIFVHAYCLFKNGDKTMAIKWLKPAMEKFPENKKLQLLDMEINKDE